MWRTLTFIFLRIRPIRSPNLVSKQDLEGQKGRLQYLQDFLLESVENCMPWWKKVRNNLAADSTIYMRTWSVPSIIWSQSTLLSSRHFTVSFRNFPYGFQWFYFVKNTILDVYLIHIFISRQLTINFKCKLHWIPKNLHFITKPRTGHDTVLKLKFEFIFHNFQKVEP